MVSATRAATLTRTRNAISHFAIKKTARGECICCTCTFYGVPVRRTRRTYPPSNGQSVLISFHVNPSREKSNFIPVPPLLRDRCKGNFAAGPASFLPSPALSAPRLRMLRRRLAVWVPLRQSGALEPGMHPPCVNTSPPSTPSTEFWSAEPSIHGLSLQPEYHQHQQVKVSIRIYCIHTVLPGVCKYKYQECILKRLGRMLCLTCWVRLYIHVL